jgi:hypothetical protein
VVRSVRVAASVANWGVRLPAIAALVLTQASVLSSQAGGRGLERVWGVGLDFAGLPLLLDWFVDCC